MTHWALTACLWLLPADDRTTGAAGDPVTTPLEAAVARGLAIVSKAAANYPKNRNCFSCHHQTLPMLAMTAAAERQVTIDRVLLKSQADFSHQSFRGRLEAMREGRGIGGGAMTVAYGLWALHLADWTPDETTDGMVDYLLKTQREDGRWGFQTNRPPLEASHITCTVLGAYYLDRFAGGERRERADTAVKKARDYLARAAIESLEDRAFYAWGLTLFDSGEEDRARARDGLLAAQRDDGGWAQLDDMSSDAYATGQALFALRACGLPTSDPAFRRGTEFLLKTQCEDGSWFVRTRSKPIQVFFDNGDPHGEHQFISIPATSWAVAALAAALEKAEP